MAGLINGRYAIERPLGGGAEGDVFLATDRLRGEQVALKVIGASPRGSDAARLRAEFRRLSRLGHSRLLAVRDLDTVDDAVDGIAAGSLFVTSDYLAGDDLAGFARRRPRSEALLGVLEDIASALDHLHGAGLLHCDVKPENIRVIDPERGRAVLIDLGLALHRAAGGREARGTPAFMDRRALAGNPDVQSDLHGLGAAFYAARRSASASGGPTSSRESPRSSTSSSTTIGDRPRPGSSSSSSPSAARRSGCRSPIRRARPARRPCPGCGSSAGARWSPPSTRPSPASPPGMDRR
jgi:serine/threonine protein kinase